MTRYLTKYEQQESEGEDIANMVKIGKAIVPYGRVKGEKKKAWLLPGGKYTFSRSKAVKVALLINKTMNEPSNKKIITRRKSK